MRKTVFTYLSQVTIFDVDGRVTIVDQEKKIQWVKNGHAKWKDISRLTS